MDFVVYSTWTHAEWTTQPNFSIEHAHFTIKSSHSPHARPEICVGKGKVTNPQINWNMQDVMWYSYLDLKLSFKFDSESFLSVYGLIQSGMWEFWF